AIRIPAELRDVVAHPLQRLHQVELAAIAAVGKVLVEPLEKQIAESIETMVHRHHHHIAPPAQVHAVIEWTRTRAVRIGAAMDIDNHRPLAAAAQRRRPDVEEQTILSRVRLIAVLRRARSIDEGVFHAAPWLWRARRLEAIGGGIGAVADALEDI